MKATLKQLKQTQANPAVSIFVKTHRTHPENEQDAIALKNQLKVAEDRITEEHDKRTADTILVNITAQTDELDHNYNLVRWQFLQLSQKRPYFVCLLMPKSV